MTFYARHQLYCPLANSWSGELQTVSLNTPQAFSFTAFVKYNSGSTYRSTRFDRHIRTELFNSLKAQTYPNYTRNVNFCLPEKNTPGSLQRAISFRCLEKTTLCTVRRIWNTHIHCVCVFCVSIVITGLYRLSKLCAYRQTIYEQT